MRDAVYRALQRSVEAFRWHEGRIDEARGADGLAEALGANRGDTFARIRRGEDGKGQLMRAFLDFLGPLLCHEGARRVLREQLEPLLNPPSPVTAAEAGAAALEVFAEMDDDAREVYRRKLARKLGRRVEDVKL